MPKPIGGFKGTEVTIGVDGKRRVTMTKLRKVIIETGIPSYQIGALAGVHHSTMSEYTQGKRDISDSHLKKLCEVLDVPPEDLLGTVSLSVEEE